MSIETDSLIVVKDRIKTYWNERSKTFDNDIGHGADETESQMWKQYLTDIIGSDSKKVLDVGTGTGMIALNLAELGHNVTGIDLGEKMMEIARKKAENKKIHARFIPGDAEEPDFPDNSFDCVICRHLLWTLPRPEKAVSEWVRICKSGGIIVAIDGSTNPQSYFPEPKPTQLIKSEQEKLWYQMYSAETIEHLPYREKLTVEMICTLFASKNITDIMHKQINEISEYQKTLKCIDDAEHEEINVIFGIVRK